MEYAVLGWPEEGVTLQLDHREFAYAGKFVMSTTGKAVAREDSTATRATGDREDGTAARTSGDREDGTATRATGDREDSTAARGEADCEDVTAARATGDREDGAVVGAVAFSDDRTAEATTWLRYVTVRRDRRGEGIGARLAQYVTEHVRERGAERVKIAVNNPFAYHALFKAGFGFTGEETGLAELVLSSPGDRSPAAYREGLDRYAERDLTDVERAFLAEKRAAGPPPEESIG